MNTIYEKKITKYICQYLWEIHTRAENNSKKRVKIDARGYNTFYEWFKKNNRTYNKNLDVQNIHTPSILEEPETRKDKNQSTNTKVKKECDFNFYFTATGELDDTQ